MQDIPNVAAATSAKCDQAEKLKATMRAAGVWPPGGDSTFCDIDAEKYILAVAACPDGYENLLKPLGIVHYEFSDERARQAWLAIERLSRRAEPIYTATIGREAKFAADWNLHLCKEIESPQQVIAADCRDRLKQCFLRRREDELTKRRNAGEITREHFIDALMKLESHGRAEGPKLTMRSPGEILAMKFSPTDILLENGYLSRGDSLVIAGQGGIGKSRIVMQLAISCITGLPFFGWDTNAPGIKWLIIQTENSNRRLQADLKAMLSEGSPQMIEAVNARLRIHTLESDEDSFVSLSDPGAVHRIDAAIQDYNPDVVVFDVLRDFATGDLNSDADMAATCSAIGRITRKGNPKRIPLVIHHALTGKSGAARATGFDRSAFGRNSKVLQGWTRAQINLAPYSGEDNEVLIVASGKANNFQEFNPKAVRLNQTTLTYEPDDSIDIEAWQTSIGADRKKKTPTVKDVRAIVDTSEGKGMEKSALVARLMDEGSIGKTKAYQLVIDAEKAKRITLRKSDGLYV